MKMILPLAAVAAAAGLACSFYSTKAVAHFDCDGAYSMCIEAGASQATCEFARNECWSTNRWPAGVPPFDVKGNRLPQ